MLNSFFFKFEFQRVIERRGGMQGGEGRSKQTSSRHRL